MIICLYIGSQFYFYAVKENNIVIPIESQGQIEVSLNKKEVLVTGNRFIKNNQKIYSFYQPIQLEYMVYYCPFELFVFPYHKDFSHYSRYCANDCFLIGTQADCDIQIPGFFKEMRISVVHQNEAWHIQDELNSGYLTVDKERADAFTRYDAFCFEYFYLRFACFLDCIMINGNVSSNFKRYSDKKYGIVQAPFLFNEYPVYKIKKQIEPVTFKAEDWITIKQENGNFSFSSIIMALSTLSVAFISFYKGMENHQALIYQLSGLIFPSSMLLSTVLFPWLHVKKAKKKRKKLLKKRDLFLEKSLDELSNKVNLIKKETLRAQQERYPQNMDFSLLSKQSLLFSRALQQFDFLYLPIGKGQIQSDISIQLPKEKATEEEFFTYLEKCEQIKKQAAYINDAYIECDLKKVQLLSVLVHETVKKKAACEILSELVLLHHPNSLALAIYCADQSFPSKDFFSFPHFFSCSFEHRFIFHSTGDLLYLHPFIMESLEKKPFLFLFYDLKDLSLLHPDILKHKHFYAIQIVDRMEKIFFDTKMILDLRQRGDLYELKTQKHIYFSSFILTGNAYSALKQLSGKITFHHKVKASFGLVHCFQMDIFQKGWIKKAWKEEKHHSLKAVLGKDSEGNIIELDLHETKDGPHGLIAGATGSGKTDLILTLMLSLALSYSFNDLQFVVLDYKGGNGILPLCQKGKRLPHLGAFISNLSNYEIERSLFLLKDECRQRQQLFVRKSEELQVTISDMDSYRAMKRKYNLPDLPSLVVIVDEFAELKKEMPNYLQELISMARVGRSLGIHLILATQKPSGIIDEQILSNIHFRLCLKVQSKQESQDMIKSNSAFYFTGPGQFVLITPRQNKIGKAAWVNRVKDASDRFEILDDTHRIMKKIEEKSSDEKEIDVLLALIQKTSKDYQNRYKLWNDYPEKKEISAWYQGLHKRIFGLIDDIENRKVIPLEFNQEKTENGFIYGQEINQVQDLMMTFLKNRLFIEKQCVVVALVKNNQSYQEMEKWLSLKILLEEENKIKKLVHRIEATEQKVVLLIEDFLYFQSFLEHRVILKLLSHDKIICFASCFSLNGLRGSYLEAFDFVIALDELTKNEQYLLFSQSYSYGIAPSLIKTKGLYSFVPALFDMQEEPSCLVLPLINPNTKKFNMKPYGCGGLFIGIDEEENGVELSHHKAVLITGLYEESLLIFQKHLEKNKHTFAVITEESEEFNNIRMMDKKEEWIRKNKPIFFISYSKWKQSGIRYDFEEIVWLGNGFSFQSLIYSSAEFYSLKDNEGVYSYNGRAKKIRLFD